MNRLSLCFTLLLLTAGLTACGPIVLDGMPCAGEIFFDIDSKKRFRPWGTPKFHLTVQWLEDQDYTLSGPIGVVFRGLRTSGDQTTPIPESELPFICKYQHIPYAIRDKEYIRVNRFLPPTSRKPTEESYTQTASLSTGSLRPYRSAPLDAVEITVVEFWFEFTGIRRITRDTIPVLPHRNWDIAITETDPCYDPPRRYFRERYRAKVYID